MILIVFIQGKDLQKRNTIKILKYKNSFENTYDRTMTFSNIPNVRNRISNIYVDVTQIDTVSHIQFRGVITDDKVN